ncbi:response regulator [Cohnella cellulosilytica]|uniref:Response regulator n=1 Tax=Cohnella cellulosilytica TaxID=986710 RepID=A0ABW2F777_9BACL
MFSVLIIDDEPWSREVVKALGPWARLELRIVGEAEDGNEGLRKIAELRPDIVITDMRMPGTDGVELLEAMRGRWPQLKIIVMSGYDDFMYLKQAIRSKAIEYLLKPIRPEELEAALEQSKKELEAAARRPGAQQSLSPLFPNREALQRYADLRERLYASLLGLNRERAEEMFGRLMTGVEESGAGADQEARVAADLLLMLERFLSQQSLTLEELLSADSARFSPVDGDRAGEALRAALELYGRAIDALLALRHSRNRLDLADVIGYIDARYQEAISLESVAGQFLVSKEHLSRVFKASTGENLSDYIVRRRMEKARMLIADEGVSIKHAAQLIGYEDVAYFYRVFKKHFGMTPGELRKDG